MDRVLYNVLGYATDEYVARAATRIQRAYRNHKSYELGWRADRLNGSVPIRDGFDSGEEIEYWEARRELVRHGSQWVKV